MEFQHQFLPLTFLLNVKVFQLVQWINTAAIFSSAKAEFVLISKCLHANTLNYDG